jgi:hypothetical protein
MNVVRSFYHTFQVFPYMLTINFFLDRPNLSMAVVAYSALTLLAYSLSHSLLFALVFVLFFPELMLRLALIS